MSEHFEPDQDVVVISPHDVVGGLWSIQEAVAITGDTGISLRGTIKDSDPRDGPRRTSIRANVARIGGDTELHPEHADFPHLRSDEARHAAVRGLLLALHADQLMAPAETRT